MKFLLDNNLPPALAQALNALSAKEGHQVFHLRQKFRANTPDRDWIQVLAQETDCAVISQDLFRKGQLEKQAFRECGLPIFCLSKHWSKETYWHKAWKLVQWWPLIIQQAKLIKGGAAFQVPWRFSQKGKFEQIKL